MWALIISIGVLIGFGGIVLAVAYIASTVIVSVILALMNLIPAVLEEKVRQPKQQTEDILLEKSSEILLRKIPRIPTLAIGYWVTYLIYLIIVFQV